MTFGPLQLVTVGFGPSALPSNFVNQLRLLRETGIFRLVDAVWVSKDENSKLKEIRTTDFSADEAVLLGTLAGALFGYGAARVASIEQSTEAGMFASADGDFLLDHDDIDRIVDLIPRESSAAFLLLEHLWAKELKQAVIKENGAVIAHGWITPSTLIEMREEAAANSEPFA